MHQAKTKYMSFTFIMHRDWDPAAVDANLHAGLTSSVILSTENCIYYFTHIVLLLLLIIIYYYDDNFLI